MASMPTLMKAVPPDIGSRLDALADYKKCSRTELAIITEIPQGTFNAWCAGPNMPSDRDLFWIAFKCGINDSYFYDTPPKPIASYKWQDEPGAWWFHQLRNRYKLAKRKKSKEDFEKMKCSIKLAFYEEYEEIVAWCEN